MINNFLPLNKNINPSNNRNYEEEKVSGFNNDEKALIKDLPKYKNSETEEKPYKIINLLNSIFNFFNNINKNPMINNLSVQNNINSEQEEVSGFNNSEENKSNPQQEKNLNLKEKQRGSNVNVNIKNESAPNNKNIVEKPNKTRSEKGKRGSKVNVNGKDESDPFNNINKNLMINNLLLPNNINSQQEEVSGFNNSEKKNYNETRSEKNMKIKANYNPNKTRSEKSDRDDNVDGKNVNYLIKVGQKPFSNVNKSEENKSNPQQKKESKNLKNKKINSKKLEERNYKTKSEKNKKKVKAEEQKNQNNIESQVVHENNKEHNNNAVEINNVTKNIHSDQKPNNNFQNNEKQKDGTCCYDIGWLFEDENSNKTPPNSNVKNDKNQEESEIFLSIISENSKFFESKNNDSQEFSNKNE